MNRNQARKHLRSIQNQDVRNTFCAYPSQIRPKLLGLRQLVLDAAAETDGVGALEETLKWGEPAYVVKGGSTVRIGWKKSSPTQYAMYFHCGTQLVGTFKEIYASVFRFEGNRAIVFDQNANIATEELKHCIALALTYHKIKHLPMLGV